jgi:hypothetical protein
MLIQQIVQSGHRCRMIDSALPRDAGACPRHSMQNALGLFESVAQDECERMFRSAACHFGDPFDPQLVIG